MAEAFVPHSLHEALQVRSDRPDAVPVAGGTDLMVEVNFGRRRPTALLDLSWVEELRGWHRPAGGWFLGAGMTFARIARELPELTALAEAAATVGSAQIRARATLGGNLGTASPAGDVIPVLAAYDAGVVVASVGRGSRVVPWREFLVGPKRTSLGADELILGVEFASPGGPGAFAKVGPRNAMVIAVAGVCLQLDVPARAVRVALGSVGPTVLRAAEAEAFAAAVVPWDDPGARVGGDELEEFGRLAAAGAAPIDDLRGSAAYRRHVVEHLARRELNWALEDRRAA
jgi:CO/xanthine dehydrogenase FAD-binding subunit